MRGASGQPAVEARHGSKRRGGPERAAWVVEARHGSERSLAEAAHEEFIGKACETEILRKQLSESRGKFRELAAKFARNG